MRGKGDFERARSNSRLLMDRHSYSHKFGLLAQ